MSNRKLSVKVATMGSVREHTEGFPVELWVNSYGRVVVRSFNECMNNHTDVDLGDLLAWARSGLPFEETSNDGRVTALSAAE